VITYGTRCALIRDSKICFVVSACLTKFLSSWGAAVKTRLNALAVLLFVNIGLTLFAQITLDTGSIIGTISDPTAAVISEAKVTITNIATGQVVDLSTNPSGAFNSGALPPGKYKTLVSAPGFSSTETTVTVLIGNVATLNVTLQIGSEKETVDVRASDFRVNTEQPAVQGVLNEQLIENLR